MMRLKRFNKNRQLKKLRYKNNISTIIQTRSLILSVFILFLGIFYFTFARFESNKSFVIISSTVGDFSNIQIINYNYNGKTYKVPPAKNAGYEVSDVSCISGDGAWDHDAWYFKTFGSSGKINCTIYFEKEPSPSEPELYDGLIAVTIDDDGTIKKADTNSEWYNYNNHIWANAIITSDYTTYSNLSVGSEIPFSDILQMYVWIPRYRYELFNAEDGVKNEQMIDIVFEDTTTPKSTGTQNYDYLTHPAFTFGSTELPGFWVAKFEASSIEYPSGVGTNYGCQDENCASASNLRFLPNSNALRSQTMSSDFFIARSLENTSIFNMNSTQVDTHLIKNMEWGAIAYLSASKYGLYSDENTCVKENLNYEADNGNRCALWINSYISGNDTKTGCSSTSRNASKTSKCMEWNDATYGGLSSTTGNLSGVYDMSGGAWEYVMANTILNASEYVFTPNNSEFISAPNDKYFDRYVNTSGSELNFAIGKLGDATKEIIKSKTSTTSGWFNNYNSMSSKDNNWLRRGGRYDHASSAGIFYFRRATGDASSTDSFRIIITKEDN